MTYAGVELGGTKCVAILAGEDRQVFSREVIPTTSPDETLDRIEQVLAGWTRGQGFDALGIASFGPIDRNPKSVGYGSILATPKPGWANTVVAPRLGQAAGEKHVVFGFETANLALQVLHLLFEFRWGRHDGLRQEVKPEQR